MLKPTKDWIVTKPLEQKEKVTASGIILPGAKETVKLLKIVRMGPDANKSGELKVGDIVMADHRAGVKVKDGDEEFELTKESAFFGVME